MTFSEESFIWKFSFGNGHSKAATRVQLRPCWSVLLIQIFNQDFTFSFWLEKERNMINIDGERQNQDNDQDGRGQTNQLETKTVWCGMGEGEGGRGDQGLDWHGWPGWTTTYFLSFYLCSAQSKIIWQHSVHKLMTVQSSLKRKGHLLSVTILLQHQGRPGLSLRGGPEEDLPHHSHRHVPLSKVRKLGPRFVKLWKFSFCSTLWF